MRRLLAVAAAALVAFGVAGVRVDVAAAGQVEGHIVDFQILPPTLTVTAGDTITWSNSGNRPHTVTDRGGLFDTGAVLPGATAQVTLTVPGTYEVFCEINPSKMNAEIVVQPGTTPPTEVRVQATDETRTGETKRFDPASLEVAAGTRLILANVGGLPHSLAAEDGSFKIDVLQPGAEQGRFAGGNAGVVLDKPGVYPFFCEIHPAVMKGTVTVTGTRVKAGDRVPPKVEPPPATAKTSMVDFAFLKPSTVVAPGGEVTWSNDGTKPHTATFDDVKLDTGRLQPGATGSLTAPSQPGSYSYFCAVHPTQMRGVLVVSPIEPAKDATDTTEVAAAAAVDDEIDGTPLAYILGALFVATAVAGLWFGVFRKRPT